MGFVNGKSTPSYQLDMIQAAFDQVEKLNMTLSARKGAFALGFSDKDIVSAILALTKKDFYKSMSPTNPNHTAWQDVYKSTFRNTELYIKFQVNNKKELILSFKEK